MAKQAAILLAEDDENDVFLLQRALEKAGFSTEVIVARDGQEAVDYLSGKGLQSNGHPQVMPRLLLLDLKMPRLNGFDVLTWLGARPEFKHLPVVVLSSSSHEEDMEQARKLGAADYKVKPQNFLNLVKLVRELHARWLQAPG